MRFYEDAIREAGGIPPLVALLAGGPESEAAISDHAGTSVEWDFEAPPWACSCARCASKTGDGRATSGCLREGYPTVRVVGEAIADVEQQYEVGMRAHAANAGVQEGGSKALAIICFGEDAAAKARKQAAADGGAIAAVVGGM